jgi:hypothetical protein
MDTHILDITSLGIVYKFVKENNANISVIRDRITLEYVYWKMKNAAAVVAVSYKRKIIAIATVATMFVFVRGEKITASSTNLICYHRKLTNKGYVKKLLDDKIKENIIGDVTINQDEGHEIVKTNIVIIPIIGDYLCRAGFSSTNISCPSPTVFNPLRLLKENDVDDMIKKIEYHRSVYNFHTVIEDIHIRSMKNLVYTFVNDLSGEITDLISVRQENKSHLDTKAIVKSAHVTCYVVESMTINELIIFLVGRLKQKGFHQLTYLNVGGYREIEVIRFEGECIRWCTDIPIDTISEPMCMIE